MDTLIISNVSVQDFELSHSMTVTDFIFACTKVSRIDIQSLELGNDDYNNQDKILLLNEEINSSINKIKELSNLSYGNIFGTIDGKNMFIYVDYKKKFVSICVHSQTNIEPQSIFNEIIKFV